MNFSWRDGRPEFSTSREVAVIIICLLLSRLQCRLRTKSDYLEANIVGTWTWPPALYLLFIQFHPPVLITIRLPTSSCFTASSVLQVVVARDSLYLKFCFSLCFPSLATCPTRRILPYFSVRKTLNGLHNPQVYPHLRVFCLLNFFLDPGICLRFLSRYLWLILFAKSNDHVPYPHKTNDEVVNLMCGWPCIVIQCG